jgi:hypothetical protein
MKHCCIEQKGKSKAGNKEERSDGNFHIDKQEFK